MPNMDLTFEDLSNIVSGYKAYLEAKAKENAERKVDVQELQSFMPIIASLDAKLQRWQFTSLKRLKYQHDKILDSGKLKSRNTRLKIEVRK